MILDEDIFIDSRTRENGFEMESREDRAPCLLSLKYQTLSIRVIMSGYGRIIERGSIAFLDGRGVAPITACTGGLEID